MLVPAQQLPVSLIGSMWNFSSCWSAPEEEGYIEGKNVEVYYDISAMGIEGHKYNLKDIRTAVIMCDLEIEICKKAPTLHPQSSH